MKAPRIPRAGSSTGLLHRLYNLRMVKSLRPDTAIPRHIGVITDGNRRWAREFGATTEQGHRAGAQKIIDFLGWCDEIGVEMVTLYVLSKENLARAEEEVAALTEIIGDLVDEIADTEWYSVNLVGNLELLPGALRSRLQAAQERSAGASETASRVAVNIAVGYGGRAEIIDAVRSYLKAELESGRDLGDAIDDVSEEKLSEHLYTKGQPDPDLIIRSSGEQRLSGFLMWQSAYSEFYFCEAYWPAFRKTDFLRAVRDFSNRSRRFGR